MPLYSPFLQAGAWYNGSAIYSAADVAGLVTYAADRGVRVVPEVDVPAHARGLALAAEWHAALVRCDTVAGVTLHDQDKYALDPTAPEAYAVLALVAAGVSMSDGRREGLQAVCIVERYVPAFDVFPSPPFPATCTELRALFPDGTLHLGADEVVAACWAEADSPPKRRLTSWAHRHLPSLSAAVARAPEGAHSRTYVALLAHFLHSAHRIAEAAAAGGSRPPLTATWADSHQILTEADRFVRPAPNATTAGAAPASPPRRGLKDASQEHFPANVASPSAPPSSDDIAPRALDSDFLTAWRAAGRSPRAALRAHAFPATSLQEAWKGWESIGYRAILDAAADGVAEGRGAGANATREGGAPWSWWGAEQGRLVLNAAGSGGG